MWMGGCDHPIKKRPLARALARRCDLRGGHHRWGPKPKQQAGGYRGRRWPDRPHGLEPNFVLQLPFKVNELGSHCNHDPRPPPSFPSPRGFTHASTSVRQVSGNRCQQPRPATLLRRSSRERPGASRRFFSPWFVEEPRSGGTTVRGTGGERRAAHTDNSRDVLFEATSGITAPPTPFRPLPLALPHEPDAPRPLPDFSAPARCHSPGG